MGLCRGHIRSQGHRGHIGLHRGHIALYKGISGDIGRVANWGVRQSTLFSRGPHKGPRWGWGFG